MTFLLAYSLLNSVLSLLFSDYPEIIRAKRLLVQDITSTSAELHWRPVLAGTGYYDIRFGPVYSGHAERYTPDSRTDQSKFTTHYKRITRPGNTSSARLSNLRPSTTYNVTLIPQSNLNIFNTLHTTFITQPGENIKRLISFFFFFLVFRSSKECSSYL